MLDWLKDLLKPVAPSFVLNLYRRTALDRYKLVRRYCRGEGLELGPLRRYEYNAPVTIYNVDWQERAENIQRFPDELDEKNAADVHILDDVQHLATVPDDRYDFVLAFNVIEHMNHAILAVRNWVRVVRPGGLVVILCPDKRHTFDRERENTTFEHLLEEYREPEKAGKNRREHDIDWLRHVEHLSEEAIEARVPQELANPRLDIHYHVWVSSTFIDHMKRTSGVLSSFRVRKSGTLITREIYCILEKLQRA